MYYIPPHETSITLFSSTGGVEVFRTLKEALKALGYRWIAENVGPHFRVFRGAYSQFDQERERWVRTPQYDDYSFVMRDDHGEPVTAESFAVLRPQRSWQSRWSARYSWWHGEGPVPGTRCHRGGRHYYRHPRTMNERRLAALVLEEEGEVAPRPQRSANSLPCAWDDFRVAARDDRNWKRFRRTQWRA